MYNDKTIILSNIQYSPIDQNSLGARLGTARPGTKSGVAPGTGALSSSVQVADRPMTQQVCYFLTRIC